MRSDKVLVVSIKPEYASKIFSGEKTIELRKCTPNVHIGDTIIIYVTAPIKALWGVGKVQGIVEGTPSIIWKNYNKSSGINKQTFFEYYSNTSKAVGILLAEIELLEKEIPLNVIKNKIPKFNPPQTFKYTTKSEIQKILDLSA